MHLVETACLVGGEHRKVEEGRQGTSEAVQHSRAVAHVLLILHRLITSRLKGASAGSPCQRCTLPQELVPTFASLHQSCPTSRHIVNSPIEHVFDGFSVSLTVYPACGLCLVMSCMPSL